MQNIKTIIKIIGIFLVKVKGLITLANTGNHTSENPPEDVVLIPIKGKSNFAFRNPCRTSNNKIGRNIKQKEKKASAIPLIFINLFLSRNKNEAIINESKIN